MTGYWVSTILAILPGLAAASTYNIAPQARVTVSSQASGGHGASGVNDGVIRVDGKGEWISGSGVTFWGEINYPWVQLDWETEVTVSKVLIYDRPAADAHTAGGELVFSDGSRVLVREIPNDGSPCEVAFPAKATRSLRFELTDGDGPCLGLSEMEVFSAPTDYVSWVDPYIETTRGRYFFFITGSQPFGMMTAAPLTRNKNQGGGGYNYNSKEVLGFPQVHAWMLSGLSMMPTTGNVDPRQGEQHWKSAFSHAGEIVQPAYHRLYLDRYGTWVEQTNTERASIYRLTYTKDAVASVLFNLGGYISTSTMVNAHVTKQTDRRLTGYFDTMGRLWGGPDRVRIFFVAEFNRPFKALNAWTDKQLLYDIAGFAGPDEYTPRNEGMSYGDAPTAGVSAQYDVQAGDTLLLKMAISYTGIANVEQNLDGEIAGFDFDGIRRQSQRQWNDWLGRIEVKGGTEAARIKFYTDLWHVLLGRHKIDDINGAYPDYTQGGTQQGNHLKDARLTVRRLPMLKDGQARFHMYNSDALWLSMWNLNILWGAAYPGVLDDFAASFLQYSLNGGLLARGPCAGGYSFIMSGCPATSLITSAYQQGLTHKWSPAVALREMRRNHEKGGMLSHGEDGKIEFYKQHGYCPEKAGLTIQWAFEDWALAEMAQRMGHRKVADYFHRRAAGWTASFHPGLKLVLPRKEDGSWLHANPLDGWGYEEANAWQATFGLSHDLQRLASLMGGGDSLCARLNYAFEQSAKDDFVSGYGNGYVSYANQPGLSNAHVFAHAGQPWLTQYWVRRVKEQAYGGITPDKGYGGHDEDQGQMGALSALMAMGLFSIDGFSSSRPAFDITSPIFDEIVIHLDEKYYPGGTFRIVAHDNSPGNCYIQRAMLNGKPHAGFQLSHADFVRGGQLDLWMGNRAHPAEHGATD